MLENMAGVMGHAMHEDRLAKAARSTRLAEVEQAMTERLAVEHYRIRETVAGMLVALATRLAPGATAGTVAAAQ